MREVTAHQWIASHNELSDEKARRTFAISRSSTLVILKRRKRRQVRRGDAMTRQFPQPVIDGFCTSFRMTASLLALEIRTP